MISTFIILINALMTIHISLYNLHILVLYLTCQHEEMILYVSTNIL